MLNQLCNKLASNNDLRNKSIDITRTIDANVRLSCKGSILAGLYKRKFPRLKKALRKHLVTDKESHGISHNISSGNSTIAPRIITIEKEAVCVGEELRDTLASRLESVISKRSSSDYKFQINRKPLNNRRLNVRKNSALSHLKGPTKKFSHLPIVATTPNGLNLSKPNIEVEDNKEIVKHSNILLKNHMLLQKLKTALIMNPSRLVEIIYVVSFV